MIEVDSEASLLCGQSLVISLENAYDIYWIIM